VICWWLDPAHSITADPVSLPLSAQHRLNDLMEET